MGLSTLQSYLPSLKNYNACSEQWIKKFSVQTPFSKANFSIFKFIIVAYCAQLVHINTNRKKNHEINSIQIPNFIHARHASGVRPSQ